MKTKTKIERGHWPAGRHRNDPGASWSRTVAELREILDPPLRGVISQAELARKIGVDSRTVRRWLTGEDLPTPERAAKVQAWMREAAIHRQRRGVKK